MVRLISWNSLCSERCALLTKRCTKPFTFWAQLGGTPWIAVPRVNKLPVRYIAVSILVELLVLQATPKWLPSHLVTNSAHVAHGKQMVSKW